MCMYTLLNQCWQSDTFGYPMILIDSLVPIVRVLLQEQHSLQLFLGNPKHPKQLIINTLRDSVKAVPNHLEVKQATRSLLLY